MEEQKTTEVAAPVAVSEVTQPVVKDAPALPVYAPVEPRHPLQDILDKAMAKKQGEVAAKPQEQAKEGTTAQPAAPSEPWTLEKWDGNPASLPEKLQKIVKDNQAAFTQKSQEAAQLRDAFNQLQAQVNAAKQKNQPSITQEEFEAAQLDPNKFMELARKAASIELEKEKAALQPILNDLQMKQMVVENERTINDFATKNPDFWDLFDRGLIEPLIKVTGNLEASYQKAKQIADSFKQSTQQAMHDSAQTKKSAMSLSPTTPQQVEVVYVENQSDVLPTATKYAMNGKQVKVRVRPK
jgi:hypothetical protein